MNTPTKPIEGSEFDDEQRHELTRLNRTERRLKQFKPRMPQLDIAAIEQMANDLSTNVPLTASVIQGDSKRSVSHWVGPLAASWICGVLVGASCVLYFRPNPLSQTDFNNTVEIPKVEIPKVKPKVSAPASDTELDMAAMLATTERSAETNRSEVVGTLRLTGRYVKASEWMNPSESSRRRVENIPASHGIDDSSQSIFDATFSQYSPTQPKTQAEMMRELLLDSKQVVH
jgi:hypothetical protein